ncbi:MAG: DUF960 domain-containing protein [Firmicutes bacterium]|nr:DUF960 domain-containing protein [Bacillota bacterium]
MDHKYTFNPQTRYLTRGISELVPLEIQLFMWSEIEKIAKNEKVDYLQVFEFKVKENHIEIEHRQEVPEYKMIHKIKKLDQYKSLDKIKIFVIDDIDHSTMLLSSEY